MIIKFLSGRNFETQKKWKLLNNDFNEYKTFTHIFDQSLNKNKQDKITWDFKFMLYNWHKDKLSIVPKSNLVKNIGFNKNATHTFKKNKNMNYKLKDLQFPLIHPSKNYIDNDFEKKKFLYKLL